MARPSKQWRAAFGAVVAAAVMCASVPVGAAPQGAGSIAGRVVDGAGNPLSGICVKAENGSGATSDGSGAYAITGLPSGAYKVGFTDCTAQPRFVEQWYRGFATSDGADPVLVMDGIATPLADVTMVPGVVVSGTVTDPSGAPIPDIAVSLKPVAPGPASSGTWTGADGTYMTVPLAPGPYKVQFVDQNLTQSWAPQFWNNTYSWNTAETLKLVLAEGSARTGIDGHLTAAATVTGTVRRADGMPLSGVCVDANVPGNGGYDGVGNATTGAAGEYSIPQLPATGVRIHFRNCQNGPYLEQWYQAQSDFDHATPLVLAAGETRTGIDASLVEGIAVSGVVRDTNGNPIAGIDVNVSPTGNGSSGWSQTDASGRYTTSVVPTGTYIVEFRDNRQDPTWASQYWDGAVGRTAATVLTLSGTDGPIHGGIDATMTAGAIVTGKVTTIAGAPIDRICVSAEVLTRDGTDWIGGATTTSGGTYSIAGLPTTGVLVRFRDCNGVGPYIEQWWNGQADVATATPVTLEPGGTRSNVNAQLAPAGQISGTITDTAGRPLQGMCAQATTDTFVGGMAATNGQGRYVINLSRAGSYKVQFVDCSGTHLFAGQWWDNVSSASEARVVVIGVAEVVDHIDAALAQGAGGTISGKVVNLTGRR